MGIRRSNSFHLLLSDDELKLLKLLAEQEGLNASDYLRMVIRKMPSTSLQAAQAFRLGAALWGKANLAKSFETDAFRPAKPNVEAPETKKST